MYRLGVVSFLNSKPLIAGLEARDDVSLSYAVPSCLPERLETHQVDAALVPIIDILRSGGKYSVISDACIGCDGETLTVRVFSQVTPEKIETLAVDPDSHTSVALATLLWEKRYGKRLTLVPLSEADENACDAILLIGDKVIAPERQNQFEFEVDLGAAWREMTGFPFVFAVWACWREDRSRLSELSTLLSEARDRGVEHVPEIAQSMGPALNWPVPLAEHYLSDCLKFTLTPRMVAGAEYFVSYCRQLPLVPADAVVDWPESLLPDCRAEL